LLAPDDEVFADGLLAARMGTIARQLWDGYFDAHLSSVVEEYCVRTALFQKVAKKT
jgi:hypothetical protein